MQMNFILNNYQNWLPCESPTNLSSSYSYSCFCKMVRWCDLVKQELNIPNPVLDHSTHD